MVSDRRQTTFPKLNIFLWAPALLLTSIVYPENGFSPCASVRQHRQPNQ